MSLRCDSFRLIVEKNNLSLQQHIKVNDMLSVTFINAVKIEYFGQKQIPVGIIKNKSGCWWNEV